MTEETTTTATTEERAVSCFVRHPDAGGKCKELSVVQVYVLPFCEAHGQEAKLGAAIEAHHDAEYFFERFRNPQVPELSSTVADALQAAINYARAGHPDERSHEGAAYPNPPEDARRRTVNWILDEEPSYESVEDWLWHSLMLANKLLRLSYEDGARWMVERLEYERESLAAQAAVALEETRRRRAEEEAGACG